MNLTSRQQGLGLGLLAFSIWGFFPFAFKQFAEFSSIEVVTHRFIWSAVFALLVLLVLKKNGKFAWPTNKLANPKVLLALLAGALLMLVNMGLYIHAVQTNQILAASFGYFVCPVVAAVFGVLIFKEKLTAPQVAALVLSTLAVVWIAVQGGGVPLVSVLIAISFALYGVVHKLSPIDPLPSLFYESLIMAPLAVIFAGSSAWVSAQAEFWSGALVIKMMLLGPLTLTPLVLYHMATKRGDFAAVSLLGFLTPSLQFLIGWQFYQEPLDQVRLIGFTLVWAALLIYFSEQALLIKKQLKLKNSLKRVK